MSFNTWWAINLRSKVLVPLKSSNYCTSHTVMYFWYTCIWENLINSKDLLFAGIKDITVQSVKHAVSSATHDVSKTTSVDFCITNGSSSTYNIRCVQCFVWCFKQSIIYSFPSWLFYYHMLDYCTNLCNRKILDPA